MLYYLDFAGAEPSSSSERFDLRGSDVEVGRANATISALKHRSVSRSHAHFAYDQASGWSVENLTQGNTLLVNDDPVGSTPKRLNPGDRLRLGDVEASYCLDAEATVPSSLPRLSDLRPNAEMAERLATVEKAVADVRDRLERNEALDEGTRQSLEHVAQELHNSGLQFQRLAKQIQSIAGISFGAIALSLLTATTFGVVRDTQKTNDFLRALYDQVGSPEGAAQLVIAGFSTFYALRRRGQGGVDQNPFSFPVGDRDMETASDQTAIQTRHAQPDRYPVSGSEFTAPLARGDRFGG